MITCNILYEDDTEIEQVKEIRKVLDEIHRRKFFFSSRTYKFNPIKGDD